ncbi:hypothetical protein PN36_29815 [Candidatus Thiomargarita nelsonii]|uniref:Uncharacterized protein n=1 Tax=Candidatus Thiomargarita nelsonii TaxID=1003181 RepID=A0A0A6PHK1_9GAMM|nr:hypothetical protein PN36_29815 [Candidatus Thiomargarita nelsonii]
MGQDSDGKPKLLDGEQIELRYSAVTDRRGSINSNSISKTDFWEYSQGLFGMDLSSGEGLTGFFMQADKPDAQQLHYNTKNDWFNADGIPITPTVDFIHQNN